MKTCPEAEHYEQCPKFRNKTCDAINCWASYPWQMYPGASIGKLALIVRRPTTRQTRKRKT